MEGEKGQGSRMELKYNMQSAFRIATRDRENSVIEGRGMTVSHPGYGWEVVGDNIDDVASCAGDIDEVARCAHRSRCTLARNILAAYRRSPQTGGTVCQ